MFTTRLLVYGGLAISLCLTVRIQALSDASCVNKYRINNYGIRSGHRLSVICNGGSVDISITQEQSGMDDYIALDYHCYDLSDPTQVVKSGSLFRYLLPGNHNENYANLVPENSRCVIVGCVEKAGISSQWYYMRGNGSSCTNEVPETSSSIATSSTALVPTLSFLSSSIFENITSSFFIPTPTTSNLETPLPTTSFFDISFFNLSDFSTLSLSYVASSSSLDTASMNSSEMTRTLITSTSSVSITNEVTSETMTSSSSIMNTPSTTSEFSETTSKTQTFSTMSTSSSPSTNETTQSTASTTSSPSIIDNTVAVIFGVLILVTILLIISCFIVIACTRKAALCTNKNTIIEIEDSKIIESMLPSEHLKDSHSLHTICADLNFKETSNIDSKENTTNTLETTGGSHSTTTTTTDKLPHNNVSTISIEYSEGSSGEVEGSCPELYDTSPAIITMGAQAYTYNSDYVVEESIKVHSLMNSSYITVAEVDIATCPSLN